MFTSSLFKPAQKVRVEVGVNGSDGKSVVKDELSSELFCFMVVVIVEW